LGVSTPGISGVVLTGRISSGRGVRALLVRARFRARGGVAALRIPTRRVTVLAGPGGGVPLRVLFGLPGVLARRPDPARGVLDAQCFLQNRQLLGVLLDHFLQFLHHLPRVRRLADVLARAFAARFGAGPVSFAARFGPVAIGPGLP